jgi:predicted secreted protein
MGSCPSFYILPGLHVYLSVEATMKRLYALWIVTFLLAGCGTSSSTTLQTPTLSPAETPSTLPEPTDPTQLITVNAGETFELVVPSNSSTGYHWDIIPELDINVVEFVGQDYIPEQPVMPGSGGVDVWTFSAVSEGETTIALGYYPPDNDTDPEETVTFSIQVE